MSHNEEWKDIAGFDGRYQVSNLGRVRSVDWPLVRRNRWGGYVTNLIKGKVLKAGPNSAGYPQVALTNDERGQKFYLVHRLVAQEFIGPCPDGMEVMHKDDDPGNPAVDNLQYGTRADNMQDAAAKGRTARGERNGMWKGGVSYAQA